MDLNEHQTPPGGWQFYEPSTKWRAPTPIASTLNQTVMLVIAMRKKNPAITAKFKLATNPEAVKSEVLRFNRKRLGMPEEATPSPFSMPHRYPSGSSGGAVGGERGSISSMAGLKRAAQGTAVGLEWLGAGANPVAQELADKRAAICVACPKHGEGAWYTVAPAVLIKNAIEAWKKLTGQSDFEFKTAQGDNLKSCGVCHCLLTLKAFVPLEYIIAKTPPEIMAEFPKENCWIAKKDQ